MALPPLGSSGFWSFLHQHLRDLDVGEVLLLLQAVQELPDGRVRTGEHAVEAVVPSLRYVARSWKEKGCCIVLIPSVA